MSPTLVSEDDHALGKRSQSLNRRGSEQARRRGGGPEARRDGGPQPQAEDGRKGVAFGPECRIFEVCNPHQAKKVLEANMSVANALPCRICVYEREGNVFVSTLKPTAVLSLFDSPELMPVAQEVEEAITKMIDAACE